MLFASLRLGLCLFVFCVYAIVLKAQETPSASSSASAGIKLDYSSNSGGLERLAKDILKAQRESNTIVAGQLLKSLILPNPRPWYAENFGASLAANAASDYETASNSIPVQLGSFFLNLHQSNATSVSAVRFDKSCDDNTSPQVMNALHDRTSSVPLYELRFFNGDKFYRLTLFAFVDGAFRFILIPQTSNERAARLAAEKKTNDEVAVPEEKRIHVGGIVTAGKLLNKVSPSYPEQARKNRIQGTVRFRALIGKDGSIHSLRVEEGICSLVDASLAAVRQWRYSPTMLSGEPVEVDTIIEVVFSLNR